MLIVFVQLLIVEEVARSICVHSDGAHGRCPTLV